MARRYASGSDAGPGRHLLAALDHAHGVVLGQVDVQAKTNEIPMLPVLLERIELSGDVTIDLQDYADLAEGTA